MTWLCLIAVGLALWFVGAWGWANELDVILRRGRRRRPARRMKNPAAVNETTAGRFGKPKF